MKNQESDSDFICTGEDVFVIAGAPYIGLAVRRTLRHFGLLPLGETALREELRARGMEPPPGAPPAELMIRGRALLKQIRAQRFQGTA